MAKTIRHHPLHHICFCGEEKTSREVCPPRAKAAIPRLFSAGSRPPREHLRKSQRRSRDSRVLEHYKLLPLYPFPGLGMDWSRFRYACCDRFRDWWTETGRRPFLWEYIGKGFFWPAPIRFRVNNLQTNFDANPILQSSGDMPSMDEKKNAGHDSDRVVFFDRKCRNKAKDLLWFSWLLLENKFIPTLITYGICS